MEERAEGRTATPEGLGFTTAEHGRCAWAGVCTASSPKKCMQVPARHAPPAQILKPSWLRLVFSFLPRVPLSMPVRLECVYMPQRPEASSHLSGVHTPDPRSRLPSPSAGLSPSTWINWTPDARKHPLHTHVATQMPHALATAQARPSATLRPRVRNWSRGNSVSQQAHMPFNQGG